MVNKNDDSTPNCSWKALFDVQSNSSSEESCQTADEDQIIEVGDVIEFYNEMYVNGHKFSYPCTVVEDIISPEEGFILTEMQYSFKNDSVVKIVKKKTQMVISNHLRKEDICI